jgi:hypothetical protein
MKVIEILSLAMPAFAAGMFFGSLVTDYKKGSELRTEEIMWFTLNTTFVILNSIVICNL